MGRDWRAIQRENFRDLESLASFLNLSEASRSKLRRRSPFPLNLPRRLAEKIEKDNIADPLFRQFVPTVDEESDAVGFTEDPVQDISFCKTEKLLQKYRGRALLLTTSACAMHCRFCFRQNFPYEKEVSSYEKELLFLRENEDLHEVILSGGDPLSLGNEKLGALFHALDEVSHLKRIRIHTRFPVGIPERIDEGFLSILSRSKKKIFFVLHVNHAREMDSEVFDYLNKVQRLGIPILSQSVLLKGVNDDSRELVNLMEVLMHGQILPYYLHVLDRVKGSQHFEISEKEALEKLDYLRENLSGFGVPRLVREEAGKLSKTQL